MRPGRIAIRGDPGHYREDAILEWHSAHHHWRPARDFYGTFVGFSFQFWVPLSMQEAFDSTGYKLEDRSARAFDSFVFLKPGVTLRQAQEELSAIASTRE